MHYSKPPGSFRAVLERWPRLSDAAQDLGLPYDRVAQWAKRDSIPAEYWPAIVAAAARRELAFINLTVLAELAASRSRESA